MKRGSLLFVVLSVFYVNPVYSAAGDVYLLPKFGVMSIDLKDADPLISVGVMWGFGLSDNVSFEAELNSGFSGGDYEEVSETDEVSSGNYRVNTGAGYLVHRYPFAKTSYFKTKFGLLYEEVEKITTLELTPNDVDSKKTHDTGIAGGIGMGSSIGQQLTIEFEMTLIDKDIVFYSLGTHYKF